MSVSLAIITGLIVNTRDWGERFTLEPVPDLPRSGEMLVQRIESQVEWEDLQLEETAAAQLQEISRWLCRMETSKKQESLTAGDQTGFSALFLGPSGVGKSLAAGLLGKNSGRGVYRIDLSRMSSRYIGETEKNLTALFDTAQTGGWVLFFDEADALFGKRTQVRDAHDRFANQQVSYLLQKIESYRGLAILATNQRKNVDEAFVRRFDCIVRFPKTPDM